jgi:hypothetical protein
VYIRGAAVLKLALAGAPKDVQLKAELTLNAVPSYSLVLDTVGSLPQK